MEEVRINYFGHSCFTLEYQGWHIALDPYKDNSVDGLGALHLSADRVFCSHSHYDHGYVQAVTLSGRKDAEPYTVEELITPHDGENGKLRGMNCVRIFHFGSLRVAHMGDLGRILTDAEAALLSGVDCMMLPVGGYYTIGPGEAKTVVEQVNAKVVIPMHYRTERSGFPVLSMLSEFTDQFDGVNYTGAGFTLSADTPKQILVMDPFAQ